MYKIVIADDEPTEIKFIRFVIETFKLPFQICGEAENGEEAIRLVDEHAPEFVILDIQMPLMDGLAAANRIKSDHPMTKVYLLTAYKYFEYAQKAVKAGVDDYLLKPIRPEDLVNVLKKGIAELLKQRQTYLEIGNTKQSMEKIKPLLKRQFILDLITAGNSDSIPEHMRQDLGLRGLDLKGIFVATFFDQKGEVKNEEGFTNFVVNGTGEQANFGFCEVLPSGELVAFVKEWSPESQQCLTQLIHFNEQNSGIRIYAGFVPLDEQSNIPKAFIMADKVRRTALFWRTSGVFSCDQIGSIEECLPNIREIEKKVIQALLDKKLETAQEVIKETFRNASDQFIYPGQVKTIAKQIVNIIMSDLSEQFSLEDEVRIIVQQNLQSITSVENYQELEVVLFGFLESLQHLLSAKNETQTEQVIKWAASYIRQNYHEEITLEQMANRLFLSPSYFSRMFKKCIGESFATFIITVRMEHAYNFLATGKYSVAQVAKKVGFCNSGYFSTVYKKHFGASPQHKLRI